MKQEVWKADGMTHLRMWVEAAERAFGDSKISNERRVHFLRVTGKRLRAVLQLTRGDDGSRKWPRRHGEMIRRASSQLSPFRDAAVASELLSKREEKERSERMRALWKKWRDWRSDQKEEASVPPPKLLTQLLLRLEEAEERLDRWLVKRATPKRLLRGWKLGAHNLRVGAEDFFAHPGNLTAHEWRKSMKELWFQTEWMRGMGLEVPLADTKPLDRLSAALGRANDLAIVQEWLWAANTVPWEAEERLLLDGHLETLKRKAWHRVGLNWRKIEAVLDGPVATAKAPEPEAASGGEDAPEERTPFSPPLVIPPLAEPREPSTKESA